MRIMLIAVLCALSGCLAPPSELSQQLLYTVVEAPPNRNAGAVEFLASDGRWYRVQAEQ